MLAQVWSRGTFNQRNKNVQMKKYFKHRQIRCDFCIYVHKSIWPKTNLFFFIKKSVCENIVEFIVIIFCQSCILGDRGQLRIICTQITMPNTFDWIHEDTRAQLKSTESSWAQSIQATICTRRISSRNKRNKIKSVIPAVRR